MRAKKIRDVVLLAVLLFPGVAAPEELTAVLTQFQGNVTIEETTTSRGPRPEPRRAQALQIVRAGDEINLPAGAGIGFVCSTDRWVEVKNKNQRLTEDLCRSGKPLPLGTYRKLAPAAGRLRSIKNALVLEGDTRAGDDEDFGAPILLSPRNTAILEGRPTIIWTQVPGAIEYEVELNGPKHFRISIDPSQVACKNTWGDSVVCMLPYPSKEPDLPLGTTSFMSIRARLSLTGPLREEDQPGRIKRLPPEQAVDIQAQLESLKNFSLSELTRQLLEADAFVHAGLFADAISVYQKILTALDTPEVRVTLGDLFFEIRLLRLAARIYASVLENNPETCVNAAAEFGAGRVEYLRKNFGKAASYFSQAEAHYMLFGLKEEAGAAKRSEEKARRRRSNG